ncbi:hypothetical protein POM88_053003 [Heracleum sosnowskyi]|uniref:Uncharacterized protein n=1 Tax=Heracleum sosnowskyi TaxID=360622 RepID=A0AAD8GQE7_9APIA|nr:hypothetical protein POM88_053003 [Heracleum sosnowskyi]
MIHGPIRLPLSNTVLESRGLIDEANGELARTSHATSLGLVMRCRPKRRYTHATSLGLATSLHKLEHSRPHWTSCSRTPAPIPHIQISEKVAANIVKAASTSDGSFKLYLDPLWSNEEYTREMHLSSWTSKCPSGSQSQSVEATPSEVMPRCTATENKTPITIDFDSSVESSGDAYYDLEGGGDNEVNSDDINYEEPSFADGDLDEMARVECVGLSPEAGPSYARRASRKRKLREDASSSHVNITDEEDISQKSGKGGLPSFILKNKSGVAKKSVSQPQAHAKKPKNPLNEHEVAERDAQIIQARIQGTVEDHVSKRQRKDGSSLQALKASVTATMTQHLFGTLGSKYAGESEPSNWWKAKPNENATALTKCLAEAFIRQSAHTKSFNKLSSSHIQLEKKIKVLEFKLEEDKKSLKKTYKSDLEAKDEELKKSATKVARLTAELKESKEAKEKMEADVARLNSELEIAKAEKAAAVEESLAKGPVEFMKEFIRKIPDFDWERLGVITLTFRMLQCLNE